MSTCVDPKITLQKSEILKVILKFSVRIVFGLGALEKFLRNTKWKLKIMEASLSYEKFWLGPKTSGPC